MQHADLSHNLIVEPVTSATVSTYRQVLAVLLPVRYPDKFYAESIANPGPSSLARLVLWQELGSPDGQSKVIAGIQCRLEDVNADGDQSCYIQALGVLAPYRELGVASQLLEIMMRTVIQYYPRVKSLSAHVWERSGDVVEWYKQRGFDADKNMVQGYYRRLRPAGAWFLTKRIGVQDRLQHSIREDGEVLATEVAEGGG